MAGDASGWVKQNELVAAAQAGPSWLKEHMTMQRTNDGGLVLATPDGKLEMNANGQIAKIACTEAAHQVTFSFDRGKLATEEDWFPNGTHENWAFTDGHLRKVDLNTPTGFTSLEFQPDGTALIDGKPVQQQALDFQLTPEAKLHLEFDNNHSLAKTVYSGPDATASTKWTNDAPIFSLGVQKKTSIPTYAKFDAGGQLTAVGGITPDGKTEVQLNQGQITNFTVDPRTRLKTPQAAQTGLGSNSGRFSQQAPGTISRDPMSSLRLNTLQ